MTTTRWIIATAPEIFLLLAVAIGTILGRVRFKGFALGTTACILIVAVILGQLGTFVIPPLFRSVLFSLFVFTIGYRSGPQFFASLSLRTLSQVTVALVVGITGLFVVLVFAFAFHLDPGTAAGIASGGLTQSSMIGTASGALAQLGLSDEVLRQQQANIAAGYAVTYILGYVLTLLFVPLAAPKLMGIDLKKEAAELEASLSHGTKPPMGSLGYRKFKARVYSVTVAAGQSVDTVETRIGHRVAIERVVRNREKIEPHPALALERGDEVVLTGPAAALIGAAADIGPEIDGGDVLRDMAGEILDILVNERKLHGRTLKEIVDLVGDDAHGVFLRDLKRGGREVPLTPETRIYLGDIMTLVGTESDIERAAAHVGHVLRYSERSNIAFLAGGIAAGLLIGLISLKAGSFAITLGGAGGALILGLVCGWLAMRRPDIGAFPPAAQQTVGDLGLGGFIAAIGLANGPAAWAAIQTHGLLLLGIGVVVTLTPLVAATIFAHRILRMNPVIVCGALAGAMTVDAAVSGCCDVAESQTPVLGVAVPYAVGNVVLTILGPLIVTLTFSA
ncbi:TrkA C-terminal domain-containing protein [Bradyrhizobium sp. HKCCYLS1011]|uniref:aspartate-alanine antiporter-like transporter n=1 Tax=Bradyrhizobium sp. HKCCYLS1011 TaxID=3420733 RepID=UPI003EB93EF0